jgi:tRNA(Ile)-lysidine synthase
LIATLKAAKQEWIEDPSNDALRFKRTQMRAAREALEAAGLTPERLAETAKHLRRAREAIDTSVDALLASAVEMSPWGYALVPVARLRSAPEEVALRALARLLATIGGEVYAPRFEMLEAAWAWLASGEEPKGRTLGGCRLARREDGTLLIAREMSAIQSEATLAPGERKIWDGRFRVALSPSAPEPAVVRPLGAKGLAIVGRRADLPPVEPRLIAATTPALWTADSLLAAPLCGFSSGGAGPYGFSVAFLGLAKGKGAAKGNAL